MAELKRKRGRPAGSKNKPKDKSKEPTGFKYNPDKNYRFWFIADACGCKLGADIIGSGMWCKHKNMMHLIERTNNKEKTPVIP